MPTLPKQRQIFEQLREQVTLFGKQVGCHNRVSSAFLILCARAVASTLLCDEKSN